MQLPPTVVTRTASAVTAPPAPTRRHALALLLATPLATTPPRPTHAAEAATGRYTSPKHWAVAPPPGWLLTDKPGADAFWVPPTGGRASLGVTVSPVRLQRLADFGDVGAVGDRLLAAEAKKDGYINARLITSTSSPRPGTPDPLYAYEYELTTTRAHKVVATGVAVEGGVLYTVTGLAPCVKGGDCDPADATLAALRGSVASFEVEVTS